MAARKRTDTSPRGRLRTSILALEELNSRRVFVLVRPFDHLLDEQIESEVFRVLGEDPEDTPLDVVLESGGGDADAAYKAVLVLRQVTSDMRVLVPRWAKSAATLFTLGADSIVIRPAIAELGPLDAQVTDPRNPAVPMSALDGYQSVEYLRDYALQTQNLAVIQVLDRTRARVPLGDILERSESFAVNVISPIMSQVRPLDFGGWGRTLDIGKVYAERLLQRYGMVGADPRAVRETADRLVYGYPHHGFAIDHDEARDLGLNVQPMDTAMYRLAQDVTENSRACYQEICDDGAHRPESGYTGFAPEEQGKKAGKQPTNEVGKEAQTDGAGDNERASDLRKQSARARHG